jgi:hypothetical protein
MDVRKSRVNKVDPALSPLVPSLQINGQRTLWNSLLQNISLVPIGSIRKMRWYYKDSVKQW